MATWLGELAIIERYRTVPGDPAFRPREPAGSLGGGDCTGKILPELPLRRNAARVFDVHLRNVAVAGNGSSGAAADAGLIDYVRVFRALKDIGFSRVCGLELANAYCKPSDINPGADPSWVPRSIGYFRGLADAV